VFHFWIFLLALSALLAPFRSDCDEISASNQSTAPVVAPIVIESTQIDDSPTAAMPVQIPIGSGSKQLDPNINDLGIELRTMEGISDLSMERRSTPWKLTPPKNTSDWQYRYQADLSLDQKLRTQASKRERSYQVLLEAGITRDHRKITYMDNQGDPFNPSNNRLNTYPYRRDSVYGKLSAVGNSSLFLWKSLVEIDSRSENNYAGSNHIGDQDQIQAGVNGSLTYKTWSVLPFLHFKKNKFDSRFNPYLSSRTQNPRLGLQVDWNNTQNIFVSTTLATEWFQRSRADGSTSQFQRLHEKTILKSDLLQSNWVELQTHIMQEAVQDELTTLSGSSGKDFLWDAGAELSSSHRFAGGWNLRLRRFSILATPSQKFGDGGILLGSSDLPSESGIRVSTGPWYKTQHMEGELSLFTEESKNAPIMVAVSPGTARTFPIGGVWTRGVQLAGRASLHPWIFKSAWTYQNVVNASEVTWQRGQPVPGRPSYLTSNELEFQKSGFMLGLRHSFRSAESLDLSGIWFKPPQHRFDTWIGYGKRKWEIKVLGNNLFPNYNLPQNLNFQGSAASNLLEPTIQQREIRFQCEVFI
jgi:hypothetical protein